MTPEELSELRTMEKAARNRQMDMLPLANSLEAIQGILLTLNRSIFRGITLGTLMGLLFFALQVLTVVLSISWFHTTRSSSIEFKLGKQAVALDSYSSSFCLIAVGSISQFPQSVYLAPEGSGNSPIAAPTSETLNSFSLTPVTPPICGIKITKPK